MGSKSGGDSSKYYRQQEADRQAAVTDGTARINAIFDGSTVGTNPVDTSNLTAGTTYYTADGSPYTYQGGSGGAKNSGSYVGDTMGDWFKDTVNGGSSEAPALYSGTTTSGGFNDDFYDGQKQAYLDYAMPQLEDQKSKAARDLTYSLARSGNLESSARASNEGDLQKMYDTQSQSVADKALDYENTARTNVENARSDLISMVNATGDADSAAASALARSKTLSATPAYSPLSGMFSDFTNTLGSATAAERARSYGWGGYGNTSGTSLYSTPSSAVSVSG